MPSDSLVVFNGLLLKALALNDRHLFPNELEAFSITFRNRRFRMLITDGILDEYQVESQHPPAIIVGPVLNNLVTSRRAIYIEENHLNRISLSLSGFPREHRTFIRDAIGANARYLITNRQRWLEISEQTSSRYGLHIVTPERFVQLEG